MTERIASVAVDVPLAHLDRPFDYAIPEAMAGDVVPGVRVRVRFAGRLVDGYVLDVLDHSDVEVQPLQSVVSPEPVLSAEVAALVRVVADHYAGSFSDVVRLAVPPRHGITEKALPPDYPPPRLDADSTSLHAYPNGASFTDAVWRGSGPRAAWTVLPRHGTSWIDGFLEAAQAALHASRGALLIVPDQRDLDRLAAAAASRFGKGSFAVLSAEAGPAARYRTFLSVSRGSVKLVLGTRAAAFAPVRNLGLIALWDDGDDSYADGHAPYPHAREVVALRAHSAKCALLLAGYSRSTGVQALVERGWLVSIDAGPAQARATCAVVRAAADSDQALARDPHAAGARLPHDVFTAIRAGLAAGPVLVQVPRAGYLPAVVCATCRETARCPRCGQALAAGPSGLACRWCGPPLPGWACPRCRDSRVRSVAVGVRRTAEEFGKAFPGTAIVQSWGEQIVSEVGGDPALVLATPGAEPFARGGYAAAVLLDADAMLRRPELRAEEEALRRWLAAVALVRPAADEGAVVIVGTARERAVQGLVRLDPSGFAARELADRREAGFPPAAKLVTIEGGVGAVSSARQLLQLSEDVIVTGPFEIGDTPGELVRLTLRSPLSGGSALVSAVRAMSVHRAAHKLDGALRVRVDPQVI